MSEIANLADQYLAMLKGPSPKAPMFTAQNAYKIPLTLVFMQGLEIKFMHIELQAFPIRDRSEIVFSMQIDVPPSDDRTIFDYR